MSVSRLNCDCVTISQYKISIYKIYMYSLADENVKFFFEMFSLLSQVIELNIVQSGAGGEGNVYLAICCL